MSIARRCHCATSVRPNVKLFSHVDVFPFRCFSCSEYDGRYGRWMDTNRCTRRGYSSAWRVCCAGTAAAAPNTPGRRSSAHSRDNRSRRVATHHRSSTVSTPLRRAQHNRTTGGYKGHTCHMLEVQYMSAPPVIN